MKILMLTEALDMGGAETHIETLCFGLKQLGCDICAASLGGEIAKRLAENGIRHLAFGVKSEKKQKIFDLHLDCKSPLTSTVQKNTFKKTNFGGLLYTASLFCEVCKIISAEKPDVVHAHTRMTAFVADAVCKILGVPLVVTAHAYFSMKFPKNLLSRWGDTTIAVSEDIKGHLLRNTCLLPDHITVIENGVRLPDLTDK